MASRRRCQRPRLGHAAASARGEGPNSDSRFLPPKKSTSRPVPGNAARPPTHPPTHPRGRGETGASGAVVAPVEEGHPPSPPPRGVTPRVSRGRSPAARARDQRPPGAHAPCPPPALTALVSLRGGRGVGGAPMVPRGGRRGF